MIINQEYSPGMGSIANLVLPQGVIDLIDGLPQPVKDFTYQAEQAVGVPIAIIAGFIGLRLLTK